MSFTHECRDCGHDLALENDQIFCTSCDSNGDRMLTQLKAEGYPEEEAKAIVEDIYDRSFDEQS